MIDYHYIYLIKEKIYIDEEKEVYKIGKSTQENTRRVKSYPSGSKLYLQIRCINCHSEEKKLLKIFNERFKLYRGREYFLGDIELMMDIVYSEVKEEYYLKDYLQYSTLMDENTRLLKENGELDRLCEKTLEENELLKKDNSENKKEIQRLYDTICTDMDKIEKYEKEINILLYQQANRESEMNRLRDKMKREENERLSILKEENERLSILRDNTEKDNVLQNDIIKSYEKQVVYLEEEKINYKNQLECMINEKDTKLMNKEKEIKRINEMIESYKRMYLELEKSKNSYRYIDIYGVYNVVYNGVYHFSVIYPIRFIKFVYRSIF